MSVVARPIRVGLYQNPPKIFSDESNKPTGIFVDLLNEIALKEGWNIEYVSADWSACLIALQAGEIDLLPDVAYSADRDSLFDFHQTPALSSWSQVYTQSQLSVNDYSDLRGRRVAILKGSMQEQHFKNIMQGFNIPVAIIQAPNYEEAFRMVQQDQADALIANHYIGEYFAYRYDLNRTTIIFQPIALYFATNQGRYHELLTTIDLYLNRWENEPNSFYYQTLAKWMSHPPKTVIPLSLKWLIAVIILSLIISSIAVLLLRKSLQSRYQELNQVFQTMPEAMVYCDSQGKILRVNLAFAKLFEFDFKSLMGKNIQTFVGSIDYSTNAHPMQRTFQKSNGQEFFAETLRSDLLDHNNQSKGSLWIIRDVTEHRHIESQLLQAQKMDSVGKLAGGVAHDFNNNLGILLGYTELALQKTNPTEAIYEDLTEILEATKRAKEITRHLLSFSRQQVISPSALDLNQTIEGLIKMLRRVIGENITLIWKPAKDLWTIHMDVVQIDQLLLNLCINARDAIGNVGQVTIKTENIPANQSISQDHVMISVSDTGCGMDQSTLTQIFEPFFTTKPVGQGTGLGLSSVYGIVKQNSGFIQVESQIGQGSTFRIFIPSVHQEVTPLNALLEGLPMAQGELILVVEDDPTLLILTERILSNQGYKVLTANTPEKALWLAEIHGHQIKLLLTDVIMPQMNGKELANRLQAMYPQIRCLYMSGYTSDIIDFRGIATGSITYLQKPFSVHDLCSKVIEALA